MTIAIFDDYCVLAAILLIIKMRTKSLSILLLVLTICFLSETTAFNLSGFVQTYILVDQVLMQIYSPMIKLGLLSWGKWLSCDWIMPKLFTYFEYTNTLDAITSTSMCNQGIKMYFDNYFTAGNEALPW